MKFSEYPYKRPEKDVLIRELTPLIEQFEVAKSGQEQIALTEKICAVREHIETMEVMARIRFDCDTTNEFYRAEGEYFDGFMPAYEGCTARFGRAFGNSPYKDELIARYGRQAYDINCRAAKVYSDEILPLLERENSLVRRYEVLLASAAIPFKGETLNLSGLRACFESRDASERRAASDAFYGFFSDNSAELDEIYGALTAVRTEMAEKLGYKNHIGMAYDRLNRSFTPERARDFRDAVHEYFVPLANKLRAAQAKRIGADRICYWDLTYMMDSGNAKPLGGVEWQIETAKGMFRDLSNETGEFFDKLVGDGLIDLPARAGKSGGGYCDVLPDYGMPFIFSNSNGTADDVTTITHESGHAFQAYRTLKQPVLPECIFPTMDACEIHSTSMEYLTWKYMDRFFGRDTEKFMYIHAAEAMLFLPYSVAVDEFQERVYENPAVSPEERRGMWRDTEKKYMPYLDCADNEYLESGGRFFRQSHIIEAPFYYLDYAIATVCALQLWKRSREDMNAAWADYLKICDIGGRVDLNGIVKLAGIDDPFDRETIKAVARDVTEWLDGIDDSKF